MLINLLDCCYRHQLYLVCIYAKLLSDFLSFLFVIVVEIVSLFSFVCWKSSPECNQLVILVFKWSELKILEDAVQNYLFFLFINKFCCVFNIYRYKDTFISCSRKGWLCLLSLHGRFVVFIITKNDLRWLIIAASMYSSSWPWWKL